MRVQWLGWAGVEIRAAGATLVIDPLDDPGAVFAAWGERAAAIPLPDVLPAEPGTAACAGLLTHLHRDHADAGALRRRLAKGAPLLGPFAGAGDELEELGLMQAEAEIAMARLRVEPVAPWTTRTIGPFEISSLPAVDGSGDPQLSWVVEAEGVRVAHFGDTMFHGFWWRAARRFGAPDVAFLPVNGAHIDFPHRQPASSRPAAMTADEAAAAATALRARLAVPMHFGGYDFDPHYRPDADAGTAFVQAAAARGLRARRLAVGETVAIAPEAGMERAA